MMKNIFLASIFGACALLVSCSDDEEEVKTADTSTETTDTSSADDVAAVADGFALVAQPDINWDGTKRADISYQLLVYSFADSDGDGWGDFNGIVDKLDYLNELGVSALWLSPIHPCMSYHGYDVTDYTAVNTQYGSESDFDNLVSAAHDKGIKIYLDYVMNHTGKDHEWFQAAKTGADSEFYDYYIFSSDPEADIKAGNIAMIEKSGYDSGEWFTTVSSDVIEGYYTFYLDWTNSSAPTLTITEATADDVDPTATDDSDARYLYYGDGACELFYANGDNTYHLTTYISTSWGLLIRTSTTNWNSGYKWGAKSSSSKLTLGEAYTLYTGSSVADILFSAQDLVYYHSHFQTSSFADLNYGAIDDVATNKTYLSMLDAAKGWVDRGVDGLRLDAVKHIYHSATSSENPTFLKQFYEDMDEYYKSQGHADDFYMVGEVLSDHSDVAPYYYGLPALFDFAFWYRLSWAINNNQGYYFPENIISYKDEYAAYRANYIDPLKLSNHDEERTATTLGKSADKEKLAAAVLLTAAGSPYIYYGEELGIFGNQTNGDEYVRSPMLWGDSYVTSYTDKIDASVSTSLGSVITQSADSASLLSVYKNFTALRNAYPAMAQGVMSEHGTYNHSNSTEAYKPIAAWYMQSDDQKILVIHNFASTSKTLPLPDDDIAQFIGVNGKVYSKFVDDAWTIKLGGYATAVMLLNN